MTQPLTRDLQDNRIIRAAGATDIAVGLGADLSARLDASAFTQRVSDSLKVMSGTTSPEGEAFQAFIEMRDAQEAEKSTLLHEYRAETDASRRDDLYRQLGEFDGQITYQERKDVDLGEYRTPDDLTAQYADLGLSFDYHMTDEAAGIIARNKKAELLQQAIANAAPSGLLPATAKLGAELLNVVTDPLEIASALIPIVGPASKARLVARFGQIGGRVVAGAVEGAVGNAIAEPVYYAASKELQLDYTMADALMNIGVGAIFGGALGLASGVVVRAVDGPIESAKIDRPDYDASLRADMANTAFRSFANDKRIDLSPFLDGTDLRGTTTLSRVDGVEFQTQRIETPAFDQRPTYTVIGESGKPITFDTIARADAYAAKYGGTVQRAGNEYHIKAVAEGDFIRSPDGSPLTFKTERAAQTFIAAATSLPEGAMVQKISGREFGITSGMTKRDITGIQRGMEIPRGVNTRERAILPDASTRIDKAVRGVVAIQRQAQRLANPVDAYADAKASYHASEAAKAWGEDVPDDLADLQEIARQFENEAFVGEHNAVAKAETEIATARADVAKAAALCMMRG